MDRCFYKLRQHDKNHHREERREMASSFTGPLGTVVSWKSWNAQRHGPLLNQQQRHRKLQVGEIRD